MSPRSFTLIELLAASALLALFATSLVGVQKVFIAAFAGSVDNTLVTASAARTAILADVDAAMTIETREGELEIRAMRSLSPTGVLTRVPATVTYRAWNIDGQSWLFRIEHGESADASSTVHLVGPGLLPPQSAASLQQAESPADNEEPQNSIPGEWFDVITGLPATPSGSIDSKEWE